MIKSTSVILLFAILFACQSPQKQELNEKVLASLGNKFKTEYTQSANEFKVQIANDSTNVEALLGLADINIILYLFGLTSREETIPEAQMAFQKVRNLDSLSSKVQSLSAKLSFLDWDWNTSQAAFLKAIKTDPQNIDARHWYSLWLSAMGRFDDAMAQSDTIMTMDTGGDYLIGRGSLVYFQHQFEELKRLMLEATAKDPSVPWGYDWLGMAYNGLEEHDDAIETYYKAFELSDGTVEVGAGLGHALGLAGETDIAKQMADYYAMAAKDHYLPQVQRAFVHLGIGEYDEAIKLLEEAHREKSWFIIFIQIEPWYDPIRNDKRFIEIIRQMEFPD